MPKSKSSKIWLAEHQRDIYVKRAQQEGYRARSVYKLQELVKQYKLIRPGMIVVDLGAAPGGWTEFVQEIVGVNGRVLAIDILPVKPISGVEFLQGDFTDSKFIGEVQQKLGNSKVDVILSDMAPNLSGIKEVDQAKTMELVEAAFTFACQNLKSGGSFLVKVFQNADLAMFLKKVKMQFAEVKILKPSASRSRSAEIYLLAKNFESS